MNTLHTFDITDWNAFFSEEIRESAVSYLESGKVLYFPHLSFNLWEEETLFLSPKNVDPKSKNISFNVKSNRLSGSLYEGEHAEHLKKMLARYGELSKKFIENLIPHYSSSLIRAKTSFRPIEVYGRKTSYRKNDALLHVDSFPSSPTQGERILRMFTNINPEGKTRVWQLGEPFEKVVEKMIPFLPQPKKAISQLLQLFKITKSYRSPYDHYMLKMHNRMKGDARYQKNVFKEEMHFPSGSSWIVFTDQVSHAALAGQYLMEQTFHLPVNGLKNPETSPLRILERCLKKNLI